MTVPLPRKPEPEEAIPIKLNITYNASGKRPEVIANDPVQPIMGTLADDVNTVFRALLLQPPVWSNPQHNCAVCVIEGYDHMKIDRILAAAKVAFARKGYEVASRINP